MYDFKRADIYQIGPQIIPHSHSHYLGAISVFVICNLPPFVGKATSAIQNHLTGELITFV